MNYATDIVSRRSLIVAGFRVIRSSKRAEMFRKLAKVHGEEFLNGSVCCANVARGNCMAAMEDWVDAKLSEAHGWETISAIRAASIEALMSDLQALPES